MKFIASYSKYKDNMLVRFVVLIVCLCLTFTLCKYGTENNDNIYGGLSYLLGIFTMYPVSIIFPQILDKIYHYIRKDNIG